MKKNVALIGIGPHAKRIYLRYIKKHKINLKLVVELESKKEETLGLLKSINLNNTLIYTIKDKYKDNSSLNKKDYKELQQLCEKLKINYMIISTEPKAHLMYIKFALQNNINVLTDKPLTVNNKMNKRSGINKIKKDYKEILTLSKNTQASCNIMCQRKYHKGYEYIKELLTKTVNKYKIPITYIDIYHSDGAWEFPHDMLKENHPYKYGYGKLFHSGYHFIDLLSDLIKINNNLEYSKQIKKCEIYSNKLTPNDELNIFNIEDYKRIFSSQNIPDYYYENQNPKFNNFGEKNFYGLLKLKNNNNMTITNVNLNLLHYGISRRGWIETKNFYKENGRIRHERLNIQVGPLLNIQVHSYQSKEIKDRTDIEDLPGGLEHFDIDIYRNTSVIGGLPFERIKLSDLYTEREKKDMLGYNELSREKLLTEFFNNKCKKTIIEDQQFGIELLYNCSLSTLKDNKIKFNLIDKTNITDLKPYSIKTNKNLDKELLDYHRINKDLSYGVNLFYIKEIKKYQVFMFIEGNILVSTLLLKEINNKHLAKIYYKLLCKLINTNNLKLIKKIIKKY